MERIPSLAWTSIGAYAISLGIATNMLYKWKEMIESEMEAEFLAVYELTELTRLRKEVKSLRLEKEMLIKASTFFVNEMK